MVTAAWGKKTPGQREGGRGWRCGVCSFSIRKMVMAYGYGHVLCFLLLTDHGNYGKIDAPCKKKVRLHAVMRCRLSNSQFHRFIDDGGKPRYQNWLCGVDLHCSLIPRIFVSIGTLALPMIIPRLNLRNPLTQHAVKLAIRVSRFTSHQKIQLPFPPIPPCLWLGLGLLDKTLALHFVILKEMENLRFEWESEDNGWSVIWLKYSLSRERRDVYHVSDGRIVYSCLVLDATVKLWITLSMALLWNLDEFHVE